MYDCTDVRYENAAQVIGIVLTNHRFLEKLDVLDVQSLVVEILNRVDSHIENKALLDVSSFQ
jgi:ABC-type ATPase involved in cell division